MTALIAAGAAGLIAAAAVALIAIVLNDSGMGTPQPWPDLAATVSAWALAAGFVVALIVWGVWRLIAWALT